MDQEVDQGVWQEAGPVYAVFANGRNLLDKSLVWSRC